MSWINNSRQEEWKEKKWKRTEEWEKEGITEKGWSERERKEKEKVRMRGKKE